MQVDVDRAPGTSRPGRRRRRGAAPGRGRAGRGRSPPMTCAAPEREGLLEQRDRPGLAEQPGLREGDHRHVGTGRRGSPAPRARPRTARARSRRRSGRSCAPASCRERPSAPTSSWPARRRTPRRRASVSRSFITMFQMPGAAVCGRNGSPSRVESRWTCTSVKDGTSEPAATLDHRHPTGPYGVGRLTVVRRHRGDPPRGDDDVAQRSTPGADRAQDEVTRRGGAAGHARRGVRVEWGVADGIRAPGWDGEGASLGGQDVGQTGEGRRPAVLDVGKRQGAGEVGVAGGDRLDEGDVLRNSTRGSRSAVRAKQPADPAQQRGHRRREERVAARGR